MFTDKTSLHKAFANQFGFEALFESGRHVIVCLHDPQTSKLQPLLTDSDQFVLLVSDCFNL